MPQDIDVNQLDEAPAEAGESGDPLLALAETRVTQRRTTASVTVTHEVLVRHARGASTRVIAGRSERSVQQRSVASRGLLARCPRLRADPRRAWSGDAS